MGFLFKGLFGLAAALALAYAIFIKDVGGRSMAEHVGDVWSSDLVQKKVERIRDDVRVGLEERLAKSRAGQAVKSEGGLDNITEADRQSLNALLERKAPAPAHAQR